MLWISVNEKFCMVVINLRPDSRALSAIWQRVHTVNTVLVFTRVYYLFFLHFWKQRMWFEDDQVDHAHSLRQSSRCCRHDIPVVLQCFAHITMWIVSNLISAFRAQISRRFSWQEPDVSLSSGGFYCLWCLCAATWVKICDLVHSFYLTFLNRFVSVDHLSPDFSGSCLYANAPFLSAAWLPGW